MTDTAKCQEDIFCGINIVQDPQNLTDLEKKHLPIITAPERVKKGQMFEVVVEVGKLLEHPNKPGHHIEFIDLYAGETFLARLDITGQLTAPIMKVQCQLEHDFGNLRAFEHCNLHGTWESTSQLEVQD